MLADKYNQKVCPVTFDQPLYIKAADIVASSLDLSKILVRLGGFHLIMSYMGAIGNIMQGSGLETIWETVYAAKSVKHMMTGHAYSRALRAHMITVACLVSELINESKLSAEHIAKIQSVHQMLLSGQCNSHDATQEDAIISLTQINVDIQENLCEHSRTAKLWVQYIHMVRILLLFLRAERTGDWQLHLFSVSMMISVLHAGGHTQ